MLLGIVSDELRSTKDIGDLNRYSEQIHCISGLWLPKKIVPLLNNKMDVSVISLEGREVGRNQDLPWPLAGNILSQSAASNSEIVVFAVGI